MPAHVSHRPWRPDLRRTDGPLIGAEVGGQIAAILQACGSFDLASRHLAETTSKMSARSSAT